MASLKKIVKKTTFGKILINLRHKINRIGDYGYVLMLHRVGEINPKGIADNENMKVTPDYLEHFILEVQKKYDIISLSAILERLRTKHKRKFVCFTFDDGYKDNLTLGYPIFKKHNVPFTIFTTACFPNRTALLWWFKVEDLLQKNDTVALSDGSNFTCKTLREKESVFSEIREKILKINQLNLEEALNNLFSKYDINWKDLNEELCLSWEEIKRLQEDPLVTIEAHTAHHYNLKELQSADAVKQEIIDGIKDFEMHCDFTPKFFAYPFGSPFEAGEREYKVAQEIGFVSSFLGCGSGIKKKSNPYSFPRIALMNNADIKMLF